MAGRRKSVLDVREMLRRLRLGESARRVARDMGISRITARKYRRWLEEQGLLTARELPTAGKLEQLQALTSEPERVPGPTSSVEPYRAFVVEKRAKGVEMKALLGLLREKGYKGSYASLRRFVCRVETAPRESFLRIETAPAEEAQVDFGHVGPLFDPVRKRVRKAWVFVMTLSFSRHQYAEIVFDQRVETWVELHVRAFESFGGTVHRVVLDNLRAGIVKAVLHDAEAQRSYRELAEHYGFLISPCRPRTPRHKGKVESGVRYVKRNALAGRDFVDVNQANAHLCRWVEQTAGVRDHGTTHEAPLVRFETERASLMPLPATRYEVIVWKQAKHHPDGHVVFDYGYYSAPYRFVGQTLWVKATARRVELYREYERVATHARAEKKGDWSTLREHVPPEKLLGLLPEPVKLRAEAERVGASTLEFIERLLGDRPVDRLRSAQGVLRFSRRVGAARLEAACRRALAFNEVRYQTVKNILAKGLDLEPVNGGVETGALPKTSLYVRPVSELIPAGLR